MYQIFAVMMNIRAFLTPFITKAETQRPTSADAITSFERILPEVHTGNHISRITFRASCFVGVRPKRFAILMAATQYGLL
jgi:hypothetical protein